MKVPCKHACTKRRRLEDLELALDAAARVNRHLNEEAQALIAELRRAQRERDAWQRHAQHLARCLAAERRRKAGNDMMQFARAGCPLLSRSRLGHPIPFSVDGL